MFSRWMVLAGLVCPLLAFACDYTDRTECKDDIQELVTYRSQAIEYAFGDVFGALPHQIQIKFVRATDKEYAKFSGRVAYDASQKVMIVPSSLLTSQTPNPMKWASSYWPYYRNIRFQQAFPVIAAIDNALWGAVLQETASKKNLSWPHEECSSVDMSKRLPCEMLIAGVASLLTQSQDTIFNPNPIERIWPEHFSDFQQRSWRSERDYGDVRRYGGIMLLRPLFAEFGVTNALTYVAQTPFLIENDNMRASALRYQERAREVLHGRAPVLVSDEAAPTREQIVPVSREPRFVSFGHRDGA
ncbi:MAG: hypothetical protein ACJ8OJ_10675 [Povalibacter sp.]